MNAASFQARSTGFASLEDADAALLEDDGSLSVIRRFEAKNRSALDDAAVKA